MKTQMNQINEHGVDMKNVTHATQYACCT